METIHSENLHAVQLLSLVVKKLKDSKLKPSTLKCVASEIKSIAQYLTVTENQALIFGVIFALQMNDTHELDMTDVSRFLDVNFIDLMVYKADIDLLISRRFIHTKGVSLKSTVPYKNLSFSIDKDILSTVFMNGKICEPKPEKEMDIWSFARKTSDYIELRSNEEIRTYELFTLIEELELANPKLSLIQELALLNIIILPNIRTTS